MKDITGKKFGKLTAIKFIKRENKRTYWQYKCDCGNDIILRMDGPKTGNTKSCGCLPPEVNRKLNCTHIMSKSRFYRIWQGVLQRCLNKNCKIYKNYGGRGIMICDRWLKFENFREDMYKDYLEHVKEFGEKNTTIDRIDNNNYYYLKNCRWATVEEQNNNTRNNRYLTYKNKKLTITQWSGILGISINTILGRLDLMGWSVRDTLNIPVKKYNRIK